MRTMRIGIHWVNGLRHVGVFAAAAGALLQSVVQRARGGQTEAMLALADFLVTKGDFTNAAGWYRAGAERGNPKAQQAFAQCLASGRGVATNLTEATRWFHLAAKTPSPTNAPEAKTATNQPETVVSKPVPVVGVVASTALAGGFSALLAAITPTPMKVSAREPVATPPVAPSFVSTNTSASLPKPPEPEAELPPWRIPPEEVGDGIHFQRAMDLPPLTPSVQEEPAVVRPPEVFR